MIALLSSLLFALGCSKTDRESLRRDEKIQYAVPYASGPTELPDIKGPDSPPPAE